MAIKFKKPSQRAQKVSAGNPSLSPQKRYHLEYFQSQKQYQDDLNADKNQRRQAAIAKDAGRDTTKKEQQEGIPLDGGVIISRLKRCNPRLWFEVAQADQTKMGVYVLDSLAEHGKRFICGFERHINPEFSVRHTDARGEMTNETRGYRTVLAKLLRARLITEAQINAMFGPPSRDSQRWQMLTT